MRMNDNAHVACLWRTISLSVFWIYGKFKKKSHHVNEYSSSMFETQNIIYHPSPTENSVPRNQKKKKSITFHIEKKMQRLLVKFDLDDEPCPPYESNLEDPDRSGQFYPHYVIPSIVLHWRINEANSKVYPIGNSWS
jgi:hypothetical protein